jgi:hypothetical protein
MAVDHARLQLVFVEGKSTARSGHGHQRARLWAGGYWCLAAATFGLIVYLGFLV